MKAIVLSGDGASAFAGAASEHQPAGHDYFSQLCGRSPIAAPWCRPAPRHRQVMTRAVALSVYFAVTERQHVFHISAPIHTCTLEVIMRQVGHTSICYVAARRFAVLLVACSFLAACEHTSSRTAAQATTASSPPSQSSGGLNKAWGSCAARDCGRSRAAAALRR